MIGVGAASSDQLLTRGPGPSHPTSSPVPHVALHNKPLLERHAQYLAERGVSTRGAQSLFWSASKPSEIPGAFTSYQRRTALALVAEFPSPDGESIGYQIHPDYPRKDQKGKIVKWMSPPADNATPVLGTHPALLDEVRGGTGPLWSVEGITRAAALAAFDIPAVAFIGCWGWQKDGEALECWRHVNLWGRLVLVAFDG